MAMSSCLRDTQAQTCVWQTACSGQTIGDAIRLSGRECRPQRFAVVKCVGSTGNKNPEINGCL